MPEAPVPSALLCQEPPTHGGLKEKGRGLEVFGKMLVSARGSKVNFGLAIPEEALLSLFWPKFNMGHVLRFPCCVNFAKKRGILYGFGGPVFADANF